MRKSLDFSHFIPVSLCRIADHQLCAKLCVHACPVLRTR